MRATWSFRFSRGTDLHASNETLARGVGIVDTSAIELRKHERPQVKPVKSASRSRAWDDAARALLVEHGLSVTSQRLAILRELGNVSTPISHPELAERLSDTGVDRVTVYRTLLTLTEAGLLVRTQLGDQVWRYGLPATTSESNHGRHPHLVCTTCGIVRCLAAGAVVLKGEAARSRVVDVQLRGRCTDCREAAPHA